MKRLLFTFLLLPSLFTQAQEPTLIKDIFPGYQDSDPGLFVEMNDLVYFFASDSVNGAELWQTDATEEGTYIVKNIGPGTDYYCESTYGCGSEHIVMNDVLYFRAEDNIHGAEIWRSDGTEAGTYMVKDINPGLGNCSNSVFMSAQYFTMMDDILYFAADGGGNNIELWRSDGTEAGTYMVKDFAAGENSVPQFLTNVSGTLYFRCKNADGEGEVWKSDGTEAGSVLLKQMWMYSPDEPGSNYFIKYDGYVYFAGSEDIYDFELWRTDGTPEGTQLFKNINEDEGDGSDPAELHILNGKLVFCAKPESENVLFVSDGTVAGTIQLQDQNGDDFSAYYYYLLAESKMYFNGNNAEGESGLWVTDGTNAGTYFLSAIESGEFAEYFATVVNGNNIVYSGYNADNGCTAVFQSNGTAEGTFQSVECDALSYPYEMITYNGKVILNGDNDESGAELWLFEPEFATGVNDIAANNTIKLYPNPADSYVFIDHPNFNTLKKIMITNTLGETVYSSTLQLNDHGIDISGLSPGIYFITFNNYTQKFTKQ